MKRSNHFVVLFLITIVTTSATVVESQSASVKVITSGLILPNKVILAGNKSLLVSEAGTDIPNTGRISLINRNTGKRKTLIDGLPSGVNNLGGPPSPTGPSGLNLQGRFLYVTIAVGDAVQVGAGPGLEVSNPSPSSPLYNSVLKLNLPADFKKLAGKFTLTARQQRILAKGQTVILRNAGGQKLSVELVINLPNFTAAPTDAAPNNVKASNLYGVEFFRDQLYIVDAGQNRITRVNKDGTGKETFVKFDSKTNPAFPALGGPEVEAVPANIRRIGNEMMLVPLLTGFPFNRGLADIRSVSLRGGLKEQVFIPKLTSAIDIAKVGGNLYGFFGNAYFTLEFSVNRLRNKPGRLSLYLSPDKEALKLRSDLISPTSMAFDQNSTIYVTSISTGTLLRAFIDWWGY